MSKRAAEDMNTCSLLLTTLRDMLKHICNQRQIRKNCCKQAARLLFNDFILRYGYPIKIHHDQGGKFESQMFGTLEEISNIGHSRTMPYHPECYGKAEGFNCTLLSMLRILPKTYKSHWRTTYQNWFMRTIVQQGNISFSIDH